MLSFHVFKVKIIDCSQAGLIAIHFPDFISIYDEYRKRGALINTIFFTFVHPTFANLKTSFNEIYIL